MSQSFSLINSLIIIEKSMLHSLVKLYAVKYKEKRFRCQFIKKKMIKIALNERRKKVC